MTRMRVNVLEPFSCKAVLSQASARFGALFAQPSEGYLAYFVDIEYPLTPDSVIPMVSPLFDTLSISHSSCLIHFLHIVGICC